MPRFIEIILSYLGLKSNIQFWYWKCTDFKARVSYGFGFMKAAISGTKRLAQEILEKGTCSLLKDGMQTPEIAALVARKKT